MIQFQQQQPQQTMKQHTRSNFNSENGASSPISLLQQQQQPIQLNKFSQYDAKSPGIKKEQQQLVKITQGKNENPRSSQEDEDDDGFHINLYAKSIPKSKISQPPQGEKKTKKQDEKAIKKDASNGAQTAIAGSASIQRQLSNQQASFLQAQLARQEATTASTLIDIQKLKYLTQLEKLLPASNNNNNNSISNTNLLKNKFEKDQEEEDRSVGSNNLPANKPVNQSNTSSIASNQFQNNLNIKIPKHNDLGDILAEKMKIIEERKKIITQIDSKSSKDEIATFPRTNNQTTKTKSKKRMSLKTENRKTRRSFACKHSRSAKSQQRLSISFDLYSIKESKSEESADGSPLEAQNTSSNLRRGFGARSFFSKVTSTEQLIPSINSQYLIVSQANQAMIQRNEEEDNEDVNVKIISTYNLPTQAQDIQQADIDQTSSGNLEVFTGLKEQQQKVSQEINQICSQLEIDQQKSSIENEMESLQMKSNNNTCSSNSDSNAVQVMPREREQQLNSIQENCDNPRSQNYNLDLKLPIQVIENAVEMKLPDNPRDTLLLRNKDESSPKENGLINLYRKNEKDEKSDPVIMMNAPISNGLKQQLQQINSPQQQQQSSLGNPPLGQSSSIPLNSTALIDVSKGTDVSPTVQNIKTEEHNRTTENKKILNYQQASYFPARNNNQSPKQQDRSVNISNSNKSPLHYMEVEIKQLLPSSNSKQRVLRKQQTEVKVIQFTKPDDKEDLSNKTLQRRSSLLDREQDNEQVTLKTEGCCHSNASRDQRNKKYSKDEEDQEQIRSYAKNYALSPQQINRRSNLQIDAQFDADRQLIRTSLPQSAQSSANYSSSYRDQFKQRLELQNIRKNPPNYNIAMYISGDKKRENEEPKQDSACSSPKTVDKSKSRASQQSYQLQQYNPQQTHQQQQIKGNTKQDNKAGSEQSSAKGSSEISSPKLASRMQSEKNKLSVIALQQKIMQQLGKSGGNRRTANTESEETAIDLQSPPNSNSSSSNHMRSPNSSTADKRIIKTIGVTASNSHYLNYGHNSAGCVAKQSGDSVDSQATRIIRTNYDTEPTAAAKASDQDNRQGSQKKIPVTIHVSDFTRGNALAVMPSMMSTGSSYSTDKTDIVNYNNNNSKSQQSPQSVVISNKNLTLNRQAKEEIEKTPATTATGLSSLKALPTKMPLGQLQKQQFPVPTRSDASMKKQLVVRPLVLDEQPQKRKPSNKFNVESKVKNYILAGQSSSQQQGYSKSLNGGVTGQLQQQVKDIQDTPISQGNDCIGEQQGQLQLEKQLEQPNNLAKSQGSKTITNKQADATKKYSENQLKNTSQQQQQQHNEYYSQFQPGALGNSKQSIRSPQIQECQQQQQQSYSVMQSDQQSTSLNPSETASTKGSTHQNGVQFEHEQGIINSKQRSYLSLQVIQQIFTPSEEAAVRLQQRQQTQQRQHSQWST